MWFRAYRRSGLVKLAIRLNSVLSSPSFDDYFSIAQGLPTKRVLVLRSRAQPKSGEPMVTSAAHR